MTAEITYTGSVKSMILKTQELHKVMNQEVSKVRPDLQMKQAQQTAAAALDLTGQMVNCIALQDLAIKTLQAKLEGAEVVSDDS